MVVFYTASSSGFFPSFLLVSSGASGTERGRKERQRERGCRKRKVIHPWRRKREVRVRGLRFFQLAWHGKGGLVARLLVRSMSSLSSSRSSYSCFPRPTPSLSRRPPLPLSLRPPIPSTLLPSPLPRSIVASLSFSPPFVCCIAHTRHGAGLLVNPAVIFANARPSS